MLSTAAAEHTSETNPEPRRRHRQLDKKCEKRSMDMEDDAAKMEALTKWCVIAAEVRCCASAPLAIIQCARVPSVSHSTLGTGIRHLFIIF